MRQVFKDYLKELELRGYSALSIRTYRVVFKRFGKIPLTCKGLIQFQSEIQDYKYNSKVSLVSCMRRFLSHTKPELLSVIEPVKKENPVPQHIPSKTKVTQILQGPDVTTYKGVRDKAVLETLYGTGIRQQELLGLKLEDIDFVTKRLRVNKGKNSKDRVLPLPEECCFWLEQYIQCVRSELKPKSLHVFINMEVGRSLKRSSLDTMLKLYGDFSTHKYRHAYATHLMENGMQETAIQSLLGHNRLSSTQIYTRVTIKELQKQYHRYHDRDSWRFK